MQIEWKTTETFFHPLIYTSLSFIVRQYSSASLYDGNWWQLKVSRAGAFSSSGIISHYRGYLAGKFFDLEFTSSHHRRTCWFALQASEEPAWPEHLAINPLLLTCSRKKILQFNFSFIWISAETQVAHKFLHSRSDFITVSSFFSHPLCSPAIWASLSWMEMEIYLHFKLWVYGLGCLVFVQGTLEQRHQQAPNAIEEHRKTWNISGNSRHYESMKYKHHPAKREGEFSE